MHPTPAYRRAETAPNLAFARDRGFGVLSINAPDGPLISHVPFVIADGDAHCDLHLVHSNPISRALMAAVTPLAAVLAVSGPDAYVSPDWYGLDDQVPTWNYIAVHLRGRLELLAQDALRPHLDALSSEFERCLAPKPQWLTDKVTEDALNRMLRQIRPVRLHIADVQGTWKLGQNKSEAARQAAARHMARSNLAAGATDIASLMVGVQN